MAWGVDVMFEAIDIEKKTAGEWLKEGDKMFDLKKYEKAISCCEKALKINPKLAEAWNNKGVALEKLGKYNDAINCYAKAIEINPNYENAKKNRETLIKELEKEEECELTQHPKNHKDNYPYFTIAILVIALFCFIFGYFAKANTYSQISDVLEKILKTTDSNELKNLNEQLDNLKSQLAFAELIYFSGQFLFMVGIVLAIDYFAKRLEEVSKQIDKQSKNKNGGLT